MALARGPDSRVLKGARASSLRPSARNNLEALRVPSWIMAEHARAQELAAAGIDFDLSAEEQAELDVHLDGCSACRAHAEGLRLDARALADLPHLDAPARVRRHVAPDPRPAWGMRFRLAAAAIGVFVVAAGVYAGTGGLQFGPSTGGGVVEPTPGSGVGGGDTTGQTPPASVQPTPGSGVSGGDTTAETPAPSLPASAWVSVGAQRAFDPKAVTPGKDASGTPPPLPCVDCGDTYVASRPSVVRAAVQAGGTIVAVGHGCVGSSFFSCRADVWLSSDGHDWEALPNDDGSLDAGSDVPVNRPTGMMDVVAGPEGFVAVGAVSEGGRSRATAWVSPDGRGWRPNTLDHAGDGSVAAVAVGPDTLVAVGRVDTDAGVEAAAWVSSDGAAWKRVAELDGATVGRFAGDDQLQSGMLDVVWADDRFVAVGATCTSTDSCRIATWTSPDGRSWERAARVGLKGRIRSVAVLGSTLIAVGDDGASENQSGRAWTSTDASEWTRAQLYLEGVEKSGPLRTVIALGDGVIAAGDGYAVQSSDGRFWTRSDDEVLANGSVFGLALCTRSVIATGMGAGDFADDEFFTSPPAIWILPYR